MRIRALEAIPYALPFRQPYATATGILQRREMVLLRLTCEQGLSGLGEAVPLSLRGGTPLATVVDELRGLASPEPLGDGALRAAAPSLSAPARCALLTALADLAARRLAAQGEAPGPAPTPVCCNATLVAGEPAAVAAEAERWAADGFSTFKLKLGRGDDVGQVRAVRAALGPAARIRVDANGAWDAETAERTLAELEPLGIELAEQPVATVGEAAALAARTAIPLAADESVTDRAEAARVRAAGAFALTTIKLSKVGGCAAAREIAGVLPAYCSSALDGPVGIAAGARLAAELDAGEGPDLAHGLATQRLFAATIAAAECELRGEMLHPPPGPGLGVEVDEAALESHRI